MSQLPVTRTVVGREDLVDLTTVLQGLVGQRCWDAKLANGEDLQLECGAVVKIPTRRSPGLTKGSWGVIVGSRNWRLEGGRSAPVAAFDDSRALAIQLKDMEGVVVAVEPVFPDLGLVVRFDLGRVLKVDPDPAFPDIPYWEIFTPDGVVAAGGPGPHWAIKSSTAAQT